MTSGSGSGAVGAGIQVSREGILEAHAALMQEADRLDTVMRWAKTSFSNVGPCGNDPVSADAALAFNERLDQLIIQCARHNSNVRDAATALEQAARAYGYTEDDISKPVSLLGNLLDPTRGGIARYFSIIPPVQ